MWRNTENCRNTLWLPCRSTLHFTEGDGFTGLRGEEEYAIKDDRFILEFYYAHRGDDSRAIAEAVLSNTEFWGEDLTRYDGLVEKVAADLQIIEEQGAYALFG